MEELFENKADMDLHRYKSIYPLESINNKRFYNIGAGKFNHPCWTNIDYDSEWYAGNRSHTLNGIQYDLLSLEPLPIEDGIAEAVYTSHTVEHITNSAAQNMFNEAYRILKPNGVFRVTTPNIDLEYRAYIDNDINYFYWVKNYSITEEWIRAKYNKPLCDASIAQIFLFHFASSVSTLHSDGAIERIDDNKLKELFTEIGYEETLDYCISRCPIEIQKNSRATI